MTAISTTADAVSAAAHFRASMAKTARVAARDAAGSPSNVIANGFAVQDDTGAVTLTFATAGLYLVFLEGFVAGN